MRTTTALGIGTLAALLTFIASVPAAAAPSTADVTRASQSARVVTQGGIWSCQGTTCQGATSDRQRDQVRTCGEIASQFGPVTRFSAGSVTFGPAELDRCNRLAR